MSDRVEALVARFLLEREREPALEPRAFVARQPQAPGDLLAALEDALATAALLAGPAVLPPAFGPYRVIRPLGRGACASVFEVGRDGRRHALKVFDRIDAFASGRERLAREVETLRRLQHPGIVAIDELFEADGVPCLRMELVDGPTLDARLGTAWAPDDAARLLHQIADALAVAHARGICHRDVKPQNVALRAGGAPVLLDFGLGTADDLSSLTMTGAVLGTPRYMAPEQAQGRGGDARSDVFALGLIFAEMLTGRPSRPGDSRDEVLAAAAAGRPPELHGARIPPSLRRILRAATEARADWRYPDAGALAADLARHLAGEPVRGAGPGPVVRGLVRLARPRALLATATLVLSVAAVVLLQSRAPLPDPLAQARALRAARDYPAALAAFAAEFARDPRDAALALEYSRLCYDAGALERGLEVVDRAIAVHGATAPFEHLRAVLLDRGRRHDEAQQILRRLVAAHPAQTTYRFNLAHSLDSSQQVAEAAAEYRAILAQDAGHLRAKISLAWLHATAAGPAAALRDPARAVQLACEVLETDCGRDQDLVGTVLLIAKETGRGAAIADALEVAAGRNAPQAERLRGLARTLR
jgi:tetratricopeptide (TPR) repeat protein